MDTLAEAIRKVKAGDILEAQSVLRGILEHDPVNVDAWLWYAETQPHLEDKLQCLETSDASVRNSPILVRAIAALRQRVAAQPAPARDLVASTAVAVPVTAAPIRIQTLASGTRKSSDARPEPQSAPLTPSPEPATASAGFRACPHCAERIRVEAVICRYCQRKLQEDPAEALAQAQAAWLDNTVLRLVTHYTKDGWQVVQRTPDSVQFRKPKSWSGLGLTILVVIPFIVGLPLTLFWGLGLLLIGFAGLSFVFLLFQYLLSSDQLLFFNREYLLNYGKPKAAPASASPQSTRVWTWGVWAVVLGAIAFAVVVAALVFIVVLSRGASPAGTSGQSSRPATVVAFEQSPFCQRYRCTLTSSSTGLRRYFYELRTDALIQATIEVGANGRATYSLVVEPVSIEDDRTVWPSRNLFVEFAQAIPDWGVSDEALRVYVDDHATQRVSRLCAGDALSAAGRMMVVGAVLEYERRAVIADDIRCED